MRIRKSLPRADNLCVIRDITCLLQDEVPSTAMQILEKLRDKKIQPAKGPRWSKSNLREYLAALVLLKFAQKIRSGFLLRDIGKQLKAIAEFGSEKLSDIERRFFTNVLIQNERFVAFLTLFTNGVVVSSVEEFVDKGQKINLIEENVKLKALQFFRYYDKREFSNKGALLNWACAIQIVEKDLDSGEYFPVFSHEVTEDAFLAVLSEEYDKIKDRKTLRTPIFRIRSRVCERLKIPNQQFDVRLARLNSDMPYKYILEKAPSASFPSIEYGLIKTKSEIYYYLRIRGESHE